MIHLVIQSDLKSHQPNMRTSHQSFVWVLNVLMATGCCAYQRKVLLLNTNFSGLLKRQKLHVCPPPPEGINVVLETDIFTGDKLFTKWPCCFRKIMFWLSLNTSGKCSETTDRMPQVPARWVKTPSFFAFIIYPFDLYDPAEEILCTIYHSRLHSDTVYWCGPPRNI